MLQTFTQRVLSRRVSWSVWMRERSSSGTEALSSPWRREATSKQDRGHLRPQPSTLKRVLLLLPARLYSLSVCVCVCPPGCGFDVRSCAFSAPAAPRVPACGRQRHADLHFLCQRRQTGEQGQQTALHCEYSSVFLSVCVCF